MFRCGGFSPGLTLEHNHSRSFRPPWGHRGQWAAPGSDRTGKDWEEKAESGNAETLKSRSRGCAAGIRFRPRGPRQDGEIWYFSLSRPPRPGPTIVKSRSLFALLFLGLAAPALADFTVIADAGRLRLDAATPMAQGSVLVLVAAGGDGTFSNTLAPGQYAAGSDIVLSVASVSGSAAGFNNSGGPDETLNTITISTASFPGLAVGDLLALRWFPEITLAQFQAGMTPAAGNHFGTYNPLFWGNGSNNPDGGEPWAVPGGGATINLNFFTTDSAGGGTQNPAEGYAPFTITGGTHAPTVTLTVTDASASEVPSTDTGRIQFTRTGATTSALTVFYALSGTAKNAKDYKKLQGRATIKAGSASANVTLQALDDTLPEPDETVIFTLTPNASYTIGAPGAGTVTIHSND